LDERTTSTENNELLIRIDERTRRMKQDIEEIKTGVDQMRERCDTRVAEMHSRINAVKKNTRSRWTGRDKALLYGAFLTAASSIAVAVIAHYS
jgi:tetrahydromethanopterin S-methyltransferase subunit G